MLYSLRHMSLISKVIKTALEDEGVQQKSILFSFRVWKHEGKKNPWDYDTSTHAQYGTSLSFL